ncbi:MAG: hypothetical protein Q7J25_02830 [Vicinamibacterales bacterium]|nr:hypothetical protein [Vicinamibacterales bacterium]
MVRMLRTSLLTAALSASALVGACSAPPPEQALLKNFFRAASARDNGSLAAIAAVTVDPKSQGSVQGFDITATGEETRRALRVAELLKEEAAAKEATDKVAREKRVYQDANIDAIKRVVAAEAARTEIKGKDAEVLEAWTKWREDQTRANRAVTDAKKKVEEEKSLAVLSLTAPGKPDVDVAGAVIEMVSKKVTVDADFKPVDGAEGKKTLVLTIEKAVGKSGDGAALDGHWVVTAIDGLTPAP